MLDKEQYLQELETTEQHIAYTAGYLKAKCEELANSFGLPPRQFTNSVAAVFYAETSGQVLGFKNSMPTLRRNGSKGNKALSQMAVVGSTHRKAQVKKSAHAWRNKDGSLMSKEQRAVEMRKRMKARLKNGNVD